MEAANTPVSGRPASGWVALFPLALFIFIDAMGFAMVAPILAAHPVSPSPARQAIIYGVAMGIFPLATFFAAPVLGAFSDRIGRRPMMIFCGLGLSSTFVVIAVSLLMDSATLLILGRLVGGFMGATQAIALAAMADVGEPEGKDARINIGLLSSSLGFVLGPVLAGVLAGGMILPKFAEVEPLLAVFILTVATLVWIRFTVPAGGGTGGAAGSLDFLRSMRDLAKTFRSPVLKRLARIFLLQQIAWGAFFFFIAPFLIQRLAFDTARASYYVALLGVGFCLSFAFVMPLLRKSFSAGAIGVGGMGVTAAGIAVSVLLPVAVVQWAVAIPVAIATAAGYGALIMLFTDEARGNEGEILGVTASINALAFGITSIFGGVISTGSPASPLVVAAVLMGVATVMLCGKPKTAS
ncbi:tetracycline resistance MFS efflux pump [soil metagenome]